jgi:hypothetical protein
MPRYFFVVRHGDETPCNSDGIEFPDIGAVQLEATKSTGDILRDLNDRLKLVRDGGWRSWTTPASLFSVFALRVRAPRLDGASVFSLRRPRCLSL